MAGKHRHGPRVGPRVSPGVGTGKRPWKVALLAVTAVALGGCVDDAVMDRPDDYRVAFPLKVSQELVTMTIDLRVSGSSVEPATPAAARAALKLNKFIDTYLSRGKGGLRVDLTSGGKGSASAMERTRRASQILIDAGLVRSEVVFHHRSDGAAGKADLSFAANTIKVPKCGDWSAPSSYNYNNKRSANFGCSNRRNLGLMLANPGDLVKARPLSDRAAPHSLHVIHVYEGGTTTAKKGVGGPELRGTAAEAGGAEAGAGAAAAGGAAAGAAGGGS